MMKKISPFAILVCFGLSGCGNDTIGDSQTDHPAAFTEADTNDASKQKLVAPPETTEIIAKVTHEPEGQSSLKDTETASGGRLCVAALDFSRTPGKGSSYVGGYTELPADAGPDPNTRVSVSVNGIEKSISYKAGTSFDNLALDENHEITLARGGRRPFFRHTVSFRKSGASSLCLYHNAFYDTWQLSDRPRRSSCAKCMNPDL